jgi:hypothetical protein
MATIDTTLRVARPGPDPKETPTMDAIEFPTLVRQNAVRTGPARPRTGADRARIRAALRERADIRREAA